MEIYQFAPLDDNEPLTTTAGAPAGSQTLSGKQIATELTNELNKAFGDDKQFDLSNAVCKLILKRYRNSDAL